MKSITRNLFGWLVLASVVGVTGYSVQLLIVELMRSSGGLVTLSYRAAGL